MEFLDHLKSSGVLTLYLMAGCKTCAGRCQVNYHLLKQVACVRGGKHGGFPYQEQCDVILLNHSFEGNQLCRRRSESIRYYPLNRNKAGFTTNVQSNGKAISPLRRLLLGISKTNLQQPTLTDKGKGMGDWGQYLRETELFLPILS